MSKRKSAFINRGSSRYDLATQAALMMDDVNTYGKCLEGIARLAYDGNVIENMSFEMNPYIMHECFDYGNYEAALDHTFGTHAVENMGIAENPGDEGNLVQASETLKTIALVLGVSIKDNELIIAPRLPWRWDSLEVNDLPVAGDDGTVHTVSFRYLHERHLRRCSLTVADSDGIGHVRVRFGPFPKVVSTRNDISRFIREEHDGATFFWSIGSNEQTIQL